ncbi:MAG: signal recognition particle protein [Anaeroplasmataceae bacterium]|nr:signal recognition particle protein [Anaeroplasmataceae bacterium]
MAFDNLSSRLQMGLRRLTGKGKLNENDIDEMLREVRLSLLEADVNYKVVKKFLANIKEQALGENILKGLNPGQQVVKIVREELKKTLGDEAVELSFASSGMTVVMAVGLQGAGKTTAVGKMALFYRKKLKKKPMLIAADIYRPAAVDQLVTLGKQIDVPVFEMGTKVSAQKIVTEGLKKAKDEGYNLIFIDTAGRLEINEELMDELKDIEKIANPHEILLTVDAMAGQNAVNVALAFHEKLHITGCILTKLDGDTRGGAALSIKEMTGIPIKIMSTGEKLDAMEIFYPDRLADRILGMGDVLSLIDTVTENIDEDEMKSMAEKMMSNSFNYNDMLKQFKMIKRMGSLSKILGFLPGMRNMKQAISNIDDHALDKIECIIFSMTEKERAHPELIDKDYKRRERIAKGSGRTIQEVNQLRNSLEQMKKTMKQMNHMSEADAKRMQSQMKNGNYSGMAQPKAYKGKGKGKGNFRY